MRRTSVLFVLSVVGCASTPPVVGDARFEAVRRDPAVQVADRAVVLDYYNRHGDDRRGTPDATSYIAGECSAVSDPELRAHCEGSCDAFTANDLKQFCQGHCAWVEDATTSAMCHLSCYGLNDPDAIALCEQRLEAVSTAQASFDAQNPGYGRSSGYGSDEAPTEGDNQATADGDSGLSARDYALLADLNFEASGASCSLGNCAENGWTTTTNAGTAEISCNFNNCMVNGWTIVFPDGQRGEVSCNFHNCPESGWDLRVSNGVTATTSCSFSNCAEHGWETRTADGVIQCSCNHGNCLENGVDCR